MRSISVPSRRFNRFALCALPLVLATAVAAQAPPPIQDPVPVVSIAPVVTPMPTYCVGHPTTALPVIFELAPCPVADRMTVAVAPPPADGVGVHAPPTHAFYCATPVDPELLQALHEIYDALRPTAAPAPAPAGQ